MGKRGLVLEGGAMRGLFTSGVLDVLLENGVTFDGMIGVSAGAAFGCNFKSRQQGRVLRYNMRFAHDKRYCSLRSLVTTGNLFGTFCYHELPEQLDIFDAEAFSANPMSFWLVCTDVLTGEPVYKQMDSFDPVDGGEWFRASASMPLVSKVVQVGGRQLLDGGMTDSIPLERFEQLGYGRNLVVLTRPLGYVKRPSKAMPLVRMALRRYPNIINLMAHRHEIYNRQLRYVAQAEREGRCVVIRPAADLPIGHVCHNESLMRQVHQLGCQAAMARIGEIKRFLA